LQPTEAKGRIEEETSKGNGAKGAVMLLDAVETSGVAEAGFKMNYVVSVEVRHQCNKTPEVLNCIFRH
jgi:hypothetical protein